MANAPEVEEDVEAAQLEGKLTDAEVMLRTAWDILDDLVEADRVPKSFVDRIEKLHAELVDMIPDE